MQEYWVVNVESKELEQYRLEGKNYRLVLKSNPGEVQSSVIDGLKLPIQAIFDGDLAFQTLKEILR